MFAKSAIFAEREGKGSATPEMEHTNEIVVKLQRKLQQILRSKKSLEHENVPW